MADISFKPNDPMTPLPLRSEEFQERDDWVAWFDFDNDDPEPDEYSFGSSSFNHWQCIQGAHRALDAWESAVGRTLSAWRNGHESLGVEPDHRSGFGAAYDRRRILFESDGVGGEWVYAGSSVDVVAHEVGHAILDAMDERLFESPFPQVDAFHEAFGDILALHTSVSDPDVRSAVLTTHPGLGSGNFLQRIAEEVLTARGDGPRNAANTRKLGPTGTHTLRELTEIMAGCWYDAMAGIFEIERSDAVDTDALLASSREAVQLLDAAVLGAKERADFFAEIGRGMRSAATKRAHKSIIETSFANHGVRLEEPAALVAAVLPGAAPRPGTSGTGLLSHRGRVAAAERFFRVEFRVG